MGSFVNHILYESSFKKFYAEIYPSKPQVKNTLKTIDKSDVKKFTFKEDNRYSINTNLIIENYLIKSIKSLSLNIDYFSYDRIKEDNPDTIWIIYLKDTRVEKFKIPEQLKNYKIVKKFTSIELNCICCLLVVAGSGIKFYFRAYQVCALSRTRLPAKTSTVRIWYVDQIRT